MLSALSAAHVSPAYSSTFQSFSVGEHKPRGLSHRGLCTISFILKVSIHRDASGHFIMAHLSTTDCLQRLQLYGNISAPHSVLPAAHDVRKLDKLISQVRKFRFRRNPSEPHLGVFLGVVALVHNSKTEEEG